jgi:hypothetical protein
LGSASTNRYPQSCLIYVTLHGLPTDAGHCCSWVTAHQGEPGHDRLGSDFRPLASGITTGISLLPVDPVWARGPPMELQSVIACPVCSHKAIETMPTDACQHIYDCKQCGHRCVYCSSGAELGWLLQVRRLAYRHRSTPIPIRSAQHSNRHASPDLSRRIWDCGRPSDLSLRL